MPIRGSKSLSIATLPHPSPLNQLKETPLHYAVELRSNSEIVRLLLLNGAEVSAQDTVRKFRIIRDLAQSVSYDNNRMEILHFMKLVGLDTQRSFASC
jgi:ankyrin repeat protein